MVFDELKYMITHCREVKAKADNSNQYLKELKEKLRTFMIDAGVDKYEGVEVRRVKTFDLELLRIEFPIIFDDYCSRIKKVVYKNEWQDSKAKERFIKLRPAIYRDPDYLEEKTARLYGL